MILPIVSSIAKFDSDTICDIIYDTAGDTAGDTTGDTIARILSPPNLPTLLLYK